MFYVPLAHEKAMHCIHMLHLGVALVVIAVPSNNSLLYNVMQSWQFLVSICYCAGPGRQGPQACHQW